MAAKTAGMTQDYSIKVMWEWDNDEYQNVATYDVTCPDCRKMLGVYDDDNDTAMFNDMFNHYEAVHMDS